MKVPFASQVRLAMFSDIIIKLYHHAVTIQHWCEVTAVHHESRSATRTANRLLGVQFHERFADHLQAFERAVVALA